MSMENRASSDYSSGGYAGNGHGIPEDDPALAPTLHVRRVRPAAKRRVNWRELVKQEGIFLVIPLLLLAIEIMLVSRIGFIRYPGTGTDSHGDYYRYINMALPHGTPYYTFNDPFLYRVLVPGTVHLLLLLGVPFRLGFFSLMLLGMIFSIIGMYTLARGAKIPPVPAMCAACAFTSLFWAVGYNVREYFLVDPETYAFIVWTLVAAQQRRFYLAAILVTFGLLSKESIFLALAATLVQLVVYYWRHTPVTKNARGVGRFFNHIRNIPRQAWLQAALLLALPLVAYAVVHMLTHPLNHNDTITVWKRYLGDRFGGGILPGLKATFIYSTWGTYGLLFTWALAALIFGAWRRTGLSGWALLVSGLAMIYSYTVSFDNQRLAINDWPVVLLLAALGVQELSERLHINALFLWIPTLIIQAIYEPVTNTFRTSSYDHPFSEMYGRYSSKIIILGIPLVVIYSILIGLGVLAALLFFRTPSQPQQRDEGAQDDIAIKKTQRLAENIAGG